MTLLDRIFAQCAQRPHEPALSLAGPGPDIVTYGRLGACVAALARRLHAGKVRKGAVYGIVVGNSLLRTVLLLALERLGCIGALTQPRNPVLQNFPFAAIFTDVQLQDPRSPVLRASPSWLEDEFWDEIVPEHEAKAEDLCLVAFTSGSTGTPKPVPVSHAKRAANFAQQDAGLGEVFRRSRRRLSCIGYAAYFEYVLLMRTLAEGGLFCFRDNDLQRESRRIALYGVQMLIAAPSQLDMLCSQGEKQPGAFAPLQIVYTGGSRLSPVLAGRVRRSVCGNLLYGYGSSEAGVVAVAPAKDLRLDEGEAGYLVPGIELSIANDKGEAVTGEMGRIRIRGDGVVRSYYGGADGDGHFGGGWFSPGDLGILSPDGRLSIGGRTDQLFNFGGIKASPDVIEEHWAAAPGVKEAAALSVTGASGVAQLYAMIVARENWSADAFLNHSRILRGRELQPAAIVLVERLPRGPSGKLDRNALPALLPAHVTPH